jgi:hypothetical protein
MTVFFKKSEDRGRRGLPATEKNRDASVRDSETMNVELQDEKVSDLWAAAAALQQQLQTQHQSHSVDLAALRAELRAELSAELRAELTALEARSADGAAPHPVAPDASVCQLAATERRPGRRDCRFRSDPADFG